MILQFSHSDISVLVSLATIFDNVVHLTQEAVHIY